MWQRSDRNLLNRRKTPPVMVSSVIESMPADWRSALPGHSPYRGPWGQAQSIGWLCPASGSLEPWARHGVLLLNTVLTVRRGHAWSHAHPGWEELTRAIIAAVAAKPKPWCSSSGVGRRIG